jgi:uncharacterized protein (TIGR03435 family)
VIGKLTAPATRAEFDERLHQFLVTRLGVKFHSESREVKGLFLVVDHAELISKLSASATSLQPLDDALAPEGSSESWREFVTMNHTDRTWTVACHNITFKTLAQFLYSHLGLEGHPPVADNTGYNKRFDVSFNLFSGDAGNPESDYSDLQKKLSQFGVALHRQSGRIDYVIVDSFFPEKQFLN